MSCKQCHFQPVQSLDPDFLYKYTYLLANNVDPDQLASEEPTDLDLHCLQRQDIWFSRTRVELHLLFIGLKCLSVCLLT